METPIIKTGVLNNVGGGVTHRELDLRSNFAQSDNPL